MMLLNYLYSKFCKSYNVYSENALIYAYNQKIKARINKLVIVAGTIINSLLIVGIISLL